MQSLTGVVEKGARTGAGLMLVLALAIALALPAWPALADTPKIQRDQLADDVIGENQVDWGSASEQIDAGDVPVDDSGWVEITPVTPDVQAAFDWLDANWPSGTGYWQRNSTDLSPLNAGDDVLMNDGELIKFEANAATDPRLYSYVTGDTFGRWQVLADGKLQWGGGAGAVDTELYRSAANQLGSPDAFTLSNSDLEKTLSATNGITGSTHSSYGVYGASTGGPIFSAGVYGTTTSSGATICAGVSGYANATGTDEYGGYFHTGGSASGLSIGVRGATSGSGNDDYGGEFDKTKLGIRADFDENGTGASPRVPNAPSGDARLAFFSDDKFSTFSDAGKAYGYFDADADTGWQPEESADDDTHRWDVAGTEQLTLNGTELNCNLPIEASTRFVIDGSDGVDGTFTVITDVDAAAMLVQYRTITVEGGIITAIGSESSWTSAPLSP